MEGSSSPPSTASSSVIPASFLQNILERVSSTLSLKLRAEDTSPVAVVALQRYLSDRGDVQPPQDGSYNYDLTITDGVWRLRCVLNPSLNFLVHKNILKTGIDIVITQCSFVYNERRLGHGYMCIENFTCRTGASVVCSFDNGNTLPVLVKHGMERSVSLLSDVPLQMHRKHYLPLWNNDDPEGELWASGLLSMNTVLDVSKITFLCDLETLFRNQQKPFPLLVKIIHKSRLRFYGKSGQKIDFPYQAYFEVADQSGTMSLVLWNDLCPQFYRRLHVGTVLYLQNYTLKQSYLNRSRPHMDHYKMKAFNAVEICLNPRSPVAVITVISPKHVLPQWGLPEVSYQFTTRSELSQLSKDSACDIIGLVTFVGRVERVRSKDIKGPEKYWTYRWIHAIDGTSDRPFIIEVFSSSQPEIFSQISPMTYLVCTQMRLCQVDNGFPYLTSSCETQMFITGYHKGQPYVMDPKVKNFIQWTKTLKDNIILQKTTLGGYYSYPRSPHIFSQSVEGAAGVNSLTAQVPLVAAADLKKEFETLQYREHKRIAIQGQIMGVLFVKHPTLNENPHETEDPVALTHDFEDTSSGRDVDQSVDSSLLQTNRRKRASLVTTQEQSPENVTPTKRSIRYEKQVLQQGVNETDSSSKKIQDIPNQESGVTSWVSSGWLTQKQDVAAHLQGGVLYEDSIGRRFSFEEKNALLQWNSLHPARWTSEQTSEPVPPAACPGYFRVTILGINRQLAVDAAYVPVVHPDEPRAVGLLEAPHDNTMLSCLSSGFLCPLNKNTSQSMRPPPEAMMETAGELESLHVVCVLDLCHLGGDKIEVLLNKVYRLTEVSLE